MKRRSFFAAAAALFALPVAATVAKSVTVAASEQPAPAIRPGSYELTDGDLAFLASQPSLIRLVHEQNALLAHMRARPITYGGTGGKQVAG